ncbi:MAG: sugar ABC transporter ATP-binding protein [Candidatus Sumerlaeota bacterium]|nr:sugar ABC transporter ATP-binding protein [Candidatus Sumerlaeota bacterium]
MLLQLQDIVKTFPGVRALDGARFDLGAGEVHALVGENGAGKSTLINVIAGVYQPDSGQMLLDGAPVRFANPHSAGQHGVAVVFQELSLSPNLSIAENIFAHRQPVSRLNWINTRAMREMTRELLALFELPLDPATLVKYLPMAQRQAVEILKAFSQKPRVLILDEPTSSLTAIETRLLFENIHRLKAQGVSFIYISHHLPEIFEIADRVTVMRDGRYVDTLAISEATEDTLVRKMVGRELLNIYGERRQELGDPIFSVQGAARGADFQNIALSIRRGEIVGLAGLVGAGRTELARAIFGAEPLERGEMALDGAPIRPRDPKQAIHGGIGYLSEDRKEQGLFLRMTVRDNCIAPSLRRFANRAGWLDDAGMDRQAERDREAFKIATPSIHQRVSNLSGGNQQKVLLAMWMGITPKLLIVDEPTRGVDIGAKSDIYALLRALAARGAAILLVSSDLQEILGLSDRVLVMRGGRLVAEFSREQATEENIIAAASGVEMESHDSES